MSSKITVGPKPPRQTVIEIINNMVVEVDNETKLSDCSAKPALQKAEIDVKKPRHNDSKGGKPSRKKQRLNAIPESNSTLIT